jgi:hypothetical protein
LRANETVIEKLKSTPNHNDDECVSKKYCCFPSQILIVIHTPTNDVFPF